MTFTLNLEFTARDAVKAVRRKDLIVVIDVLRCTSSILNAFANGAEKAIPTRTLAEAYRLHREHPSFLLAGERGGVRPRGFQVVLQIVWAYDASCNRENQDESRTLYFRQKR